MSSWVKTAFNRHSGRHVPEEPRIHTVHSRNRTGAMKHFLPGPEARRVAEQIECVTHEGSNHISPQRGVPGDQQRRRWTQSESKAQL